MRHQIVLVPMLVPLMVKCPACRRPIALTSRSTVIRWHKAEDGSPCPAAGMSLEGVARARKGGGKTDGGAEFVVAG